MKGLVMGRMVRYADRNTDGTGTGTPKIFPALVVRVLEETVNLVVFNDEYLDPALPQYRVPYAPQESKEGHTWHWPPKDE